VTLGDGPAARTRADGGYRDRDEGRLLVVVIRITVGVVARLRVRWAVLWREATEPSGRRHADPTSIAVNSRDFRDRIGDRRPGPIHHTPDKIYSEADSNQEG